MGYNARNDESLSRRLDWNRPVITQPSFELDGIALAARRAGREKQTNASAERRPMSGEGEQLC